MRIEGSGTHFTVTGIDRLTAANVASLRKQMMCVLPAHVSQFDIDLSQTSFVDSSGLGELMLVHRRACELGANVRLLHPREEIRLSLALMQFQRLFEIV